jgi:Uma2 family endonuclease
MFPITTPPPAVPALEVGPSAGILGSLFRMNVDQYERLVQTGVLDGQAVELINGLLVRKMGKKPPHVISCEALRDELPPVTPPGWRLTIEAPVRIPDFDEPEPDLALVRGKREDYADHHPGPADVALLIEVSDTTLERDRGEKRTAFALGGVTIYWILNLVDRQLEIYAEPSATGYQQEQLLKAGDQAPVLIDGTEVGRIALSDILPPIASSGGNGSEIFP